MKTEQQKLRFVSGPILLQRLFDDECRPTMKWLRSMTKRKEIPFHKIGGMVLFVEDEVRNHIKTYLYQRAEVSKEMKFRAENPTYVKEYERFVNEFRIHPKYKSDSQIPGLFNENLKNWFYSHKRNPSFQQWLSACDQWGTWARDGDGNPIKLVACRS